MAKTLRVNIVARHFLPFLILTVAMFSSVAIATDRHGQALKDGGHFDCFPIGTFGLRGVRLWESVSQVRMKLGQPAYVTVSEGFGDDDGGQYRLITYHYENIEISFVRGAVDRIYTTSP